MPLPRKVVDCHTHFLDPANNCFQSFLRGLGAQSYLPEQYEEDTQSLEVSQAVVVEAMPDCGIEEVLWIESLISDGRCSHVSAIVAQCDLSRPQADTETYLAALLEASPDRLRGVRYILDYNGKYEKGSNNGTHVGCTRHNLDYLRDPTASLRFEDGFKLLSRFNLSFDLQCAPVQLPAAAKICERYPDVVVCIDHMGRPHDLKIDIIPTSSLGSDAYHFVIPEETSEKMAVWRHGMQLMAKLPHVYVKLSMLGYAVPGWHEDKTKEMFLKSIVLEVISLFGAGRCMFGSNYHINSTVSDSDGTYATGPSIHEMFEHFQSWVSDFPQHHQDMLFSGTATDFYRLSSSYI